MSDQYRDALLSALPGCDLPSELVAWLVRGLSIQQAGGDLLAGLGLDGPDLDRRDSLIKTVILLSPGDSLAAQCSHFLECMSGEREHPRADLQKQIEALQLLDVPRHVRHLRRIVDGRRQDGWRVT